MMRFGLRCKSIVDVNKVGGELITMRRVIFTPQRGHQGRAEEDQHQHHLLRPQRRAGEA